MPLVDLSADARLGTTRARRWRAHPETRDVRRSGRRRNVLAPPTRLSNCRWLIHSPTCPGRGFRANPQLYRQGTPYPLSSLNLYILRQTTTPFLFALIATTAIVWATQSLTRLDIIVDHGQGLAKFAWLTVLILPSLLAVVIPFALFGATLYALHRLHADSEIAVAFAAGVSRLRIAAPILLLTTIGAGATLWINLDLMPRSYRELKREIFSMRADFASAILRAGEFTTFVDGFTVYVDRTDGEGQFIGLLINDYREPTRSSTYLAERGVVRQTPSGPVLYLLNGVAQRPDAETGQMGSVSFQRLALNLSDFGGAADGFQMELTERYLGELLHPDLAKEWDRNNAGRLVAEGHARLAAPLYAFAYALMAIAALIGGAYSRQGYALRIVIACVGAIVLRVIGFLVQSLAASTGLYWLVYAPMTIVVVVCALLLFDLPAFARARPRAGT